ncbi:MAG: molybdenum ABC transporter ATP-binding protein [Acidobacteriota bacterium]
MSDLTASFERKLPSGPGISVELSLPADGFSVTVLFGPSGSGKTTILRCLAGLEKPDSGRISFDGTTWFDSARGVDEPPARRRIGYLPQEYSLFPHLTVEGNVGYGLRRVAASERRARVREMLVRLDLTPLARRHPDRISGGEQQRVALARALVVRPRLLLLDEPLSALDAPLRERLRPELRRLLSDSGAPVVFVTHERLDAISLADRVAVVDLGRILQVGSVEEVFNRPSGLRAAEIVGIETVRPAHVTSVENGLASVAIGRASVTAVAPHGISGDVYACVRAEEVALERGPGGTSSVRNRLPARVLGLEPAGATVRVLLDAGFPLAALVTRSACAELDLRPGETLFALMKAPSIHLVPR